MTRTSARVEIWSDVACPWCYVGKRNLEVALRRFAHRDEVELIWRSFELDPSAKPDPDRDYVTTIAEKYGMEVAAARKMIGTITATARGSGLQLDLEGARPANTHDAHRLLHLANEFRCQAALKERLFSAALSERAAIDDERTLLRLATEAGLPRERVHDLLSGEAFATDVRADEARAAELGITGVPFFLIDGARGLAGAQPPDVLLHALEVAFAIRA